MSTQASAWISARSRQRKSQLAFAIGSSVDRLLFALRMLRKPTAKTRSREKGLGTTAAQFAGAILCGSHFTEIAQIGAISRGFQQKKRRFLCSADCVAEREGFEPSVRFYR